MEGLYDSSSTVLSRTTHIFNKEDFSDVLLIVGEAEVLYPGHKLLLSLASPVFAHILEEKSSDGKIITLPIPDVSPRVFHKVLKYMYTDEMKINTVGEARRILLLADKYQILPLSSICKAYIVERSISPQIVIKMYETAVGAKLQMGDVQELCMYTFSEETKAIFQSDSFVKARQSTIEAILKLDMLSVDNEMEVLSAVLEWGKTQCHANGLPVDTNLRVILGSLFKHIRFLTIPLSDLKVFWKKYTNLMTSEEVCAVTVALLQPDIGIEIPKTLCSLMNPRNAPNYCREENMEPDSSTKDNSILNTSFTSEETLVKVLNSNPVLQVNECSTSKEISTNIKEESSSSVLFSSIPKSVPTEVENSNNCLEHISMTKTFRETESYISNDLKVLVEKNSERRVIACSSNIPTLSQMNNISEDCTKKTLSVIEVSDNEAEVPIGIRTVVSPQKIESESESENESDASDSEAETIPMENCIGIEIELNNSKEIPRGGRTADVTSAITLTLTKGSIELIGVKVQLKKVSYLVNEPFNVLTSLKMADKNHEQAERMNDSLSPFDVVFKKPVHVRVGNKVKILVTVEEVQLRRCFLCTEPNIHGCDDRGNTFDIQINGNQSIDKIGVPFVVSQILYNYEE